MNIFKRFFVNYYRRKAMAKLGSVLLYYFYESNILGRDAEDEYGDAMRLINGALLQIQDEYVKATYGNDAKLSIVTCPGCGHDGSCFC